MLFRLLSSRAAWHTEHGAQKNITEQSSHGSSGKSYFSRRTLRVAVRARHGSGLTSGRVGSGRVGSGRATEKVFGLGSDRVGFKYIRIGSGRVTKN